MSVPKVLTNGWVETVDLTSEVSSEIENVGGTGLFAFIPVAFSL